MAARTSPHSSLPETEPFLERGDAEKNAAAEAQAGECLVRRQSKWYNSPFWLVLSVTLAIALAAQNLLYVLGGKDGYADGFETEIDYLKPTINLHKTRFAGAILATPEGDGLHVPNPALDDLGRPFTGPPSPEIDAAWHDLIYGRYVRFTSPEVSWLASDTDVAPVMPLAHKANTTLIPTPGIYGGPDMLHSLHCINGLRKHLNISYYGASMGEQKMRYERMHVDHCLEQLRQAVLCHGDLTPVTLRPVAREDGTVWGYLGETEREHVCRNGVELARRWVERGEGDARVEAE